MPNYTFKCSCGIGFVIYRGLSHFSDSFTCECGKLARLVISAPLLVKASADVCYDSPIDGQPITSWAQRREDLKRHNCIEYDPECKTDRAKKLKDSEAALDRTIDEHVERTIAQMPTAQRGKLYSELTEQGVQADVVRSTPHA